jgi:hypothetical protein
LFVIGYRNRSFNFGSFFISNLKLTLFVVFWDMLTISMIALKQTDKLDSWSISCQSYKNFFASSLMPRQSKPECFTLLGILDYNFDQHKNYPQTLDKAGIVSQGQTLKLIWPDEENRWKSLVPVVNIINSLRVQLTTVEKYISNR